MVHCGNSSQEGFWHFLSVPPRATHFPAPSATPQNMNQRNKPKKILPLCTEHNFRETQSLRK
jgi:hypothetical protein